MEDVFNCRECGKVDKTWTRHESRGMECDEFPYGYYKSSMIEGEKFSKPESVKNHRWARYDYYGIYTELCCDKCYKNNYSYKKGAYSQW